MVASDSPFLADLVGLKGGSQNPVTDGPFLDLGRAATSSTLEVFRLF